MQKIILDVVPNGIEPRVYVNQFDTGRTFQIAFKENFGSYYFPNDVVFRINGRKADNHVFEYSEADKWDATHYVITKSGSGDSLVVTIATTEQMTAAAGETKVQLTFKSSSASNDILGTLNFILAVQEQPYANGDPSGSDFPEIIAMATEQMLNAEAWAVGEKDGVPVASTEPQYHNNSSYYAQRARTSASSAANSNTMAAVSASAAEGAATKAEAVAAHPPRLDPPGVTPNGNWWIWDNTLNPPAYRDSGVNAGVSCDVDPNTVTLPAGSSAAVQNTGTQTDPRFKFSIPKGDKGDKGDTGPIGPTGDSQDVLEAVGWTGSNLLPIKITSSNASLSYTISDVGINIVKSSTTSDYASLIIKVPAELSGNYYFSGCPSGGGSSTFDLYMWDFTANARCKMWDGSTPAPFVTWSGNYQVQIPSGHSVAYIIRFVSSYTTPASGITFSPMISRNGGEYVPYHPTVEQCKFNSANVAPTEDGAGASQAYSTGQYLIHGGELRKATTAIASGAEITDNNTDETTIGGELEQISNKTPTIYSKQISGVSIDEAWGDMYKKQFDITVDKDWRNKDVSVSFSPISPQTITLLCAITAVTSTTITVMLIRPTTTTSVAGKIFVHCYEAS